MSRRFQVGSAVVEPPLHQISRNGRLHRLEPRVMRVLLCLAARPGEVLTRDELLSSVWAEGLPSDEGLTQAICKLRKAFGDRAGQATVIETIPKVGYRLIAPITTTSPTSNGHAKTAPSGQAPPPLASSVSPPLRPAAFGLGGGLEAWRWLAVCFALLVLFCGLWASYIAHRPFPIEQRRVFIQHAESDSTLGPQRMRILVRGYSISPQNPPRNSSPSSPY